MEMYCEIITHNYYTIYLFSYLSITNSKNMGHFSYGILLAINRHACLERTESRNSIGKVTFARIQSVRLDNSETHWLGVFAVVSMGGLSLFCLQP